MCWFDKENGESELFELYPDLLGSLLKDKTSNKNIIWATNNYKNKGFNEKDEITIQSISGKNRKIIKPRIHKSKLEQLKRSKDMAEVFTPSWVCNKQNNLIDNEWFGYVGSFNIENEDNTWTPTEKVDFKDKNYIDYINDTRLEITCGEAPYLVNRYDTVTGLKIDIKSRVGLLDRKLRVVNENSLTDDDWIKNSILSLKATYGYEYQGDNLLIARENILFTFIDYYFERFNELPSKELLDEVVEIITWNLWQMDGLKMVIPMSCKDDFVVQYDLFGEKRVEGFKCTGCEKNLIHQHNGKKCYVMDWEKNKKVRFLDLMKGGIW